MVTLEQPVTQLAGIGAQTAGRLRKLGIYRLHDMLLHLPYRYEDRTRIHPIGSLSAGLSALIRGRVEFAEIVPRGRKSLVVRIGDGTGFIHLRFYHYHIGQQTALHPGATVSCFAEVRQGFAGLEMVHPDFAVLNDKTGALPETGLIPVYPAAEGLPQTLFRKAVRQILNLCRRHKELLIDYLPEALLAEYDYPPLIAALETMHAPDASLTPEILQNRRSLALKRLAFEELLAHHLSLRGLRQSSNRLTAPALAAKPGLAADFAKALPFPLTGAQQRVIADIEADCGRAQPMMRLVQGDVGSGKTVVAAHAALLALANGCQVAVMAPTELLAEQHLRNFRRWFDASGARIELLTGALKGSARKSLTTALAEGRIDILIGTHALFQDAVEFHRLGLVVIDEQHRFGVHQRLALRQKGERQGLKPHQLVMTATPIPRTLAMLHYSDLDISVIDELPPGRKPVVTSVVPAHRRHEVMARIRDWVGKQRQAYWVCTLIEDSEALQCQAAEQTAEVLRQALPSVRIGLLHGRMKSADKDAVMQDFKNGRIDLLVATTVIEVGVDVANAGLMVIENPERLGLSQLHQLRGRVGRGRDDSYCVLLYQAPLSETARQRLGILRDSGDGFVIAEKDLELRGPGDLLGTRQTGRIQLKVADLSRDSDLLDAIGRDADRLWQAFPDSIPALTTRWLGQAGDYSEV